jgi:hypothetical protein
LLKLCKVADFVAAETTGAAALAVGEITGPVALAEVLDVTAETVELSVGVTVAKTPVVGGFGGAGAAGEETLDAGLVGAAAATWDNVVAAADAALGALGVAALGALGVTALGALGVTTLGALGTAAESAFDAAAVTELVGTGRVLADASPRKSRRNRMPARAARAPRIAHRATVRAPMA